MNINHSPLFLLSFITVICEAQLSVKGKLADEKGSPVSFASVMLLSSADSTLVKGQVSSADGIFTIELKDEGSYFVSVTAVGYQTHHTPVFKLHSSYQHHDIGKVVVQEKVEQLNEVVVKAEKPMFEQRIDRMVINVGSSITRAGGSALDVLQRSPGVIVDRVNYGLSLSGKQGVRVMINGKLSRIPMTAIVQMLAGTNSENVERVELITTPPSKYEAEGDAGIINIVMKQSEDKGTNGSLSMVSGYGRKAKYGGTLVFNHRTSKLNLYGDFGSRKDITRQYFSSNWQVPVDSELKRTITSNDRNATTGNISAKVGFDAALTKRTSIGGEFSYFSRSWDMDALATISRLTNQIQSSSVLMSTIEANDFSPKTGSLNIDHKFNDRYSITADVDRINYDQTNPTSYHLDYFDNQGVKTSTGELYSSKDTHIKIWTSSVDFVGKVNDQISIEAGAKGSFSKLTNDVAVNQLVDGVWSSDLGLTSYASMHENIGAAYFSSSVKASEKLSVQAGIRYEHTITNIDTRTEQNVVDRNYGKWFPTIFINHKINDKNSWVVSYSRRITRPTYWQLAPFVIFNDPNSFYSGNVTLFPSFTNSVKMEYLQNSRLISLQYSHDDNLISVFQPSINKDNKQVGMAQNMDYRDNLSLTISFPIHFNDWWEMQLTGIGSTSSTRANYLNDPIIVKNKNISLNGSSKFKISKSIIAELTGSYNSRQLLGISEFRAFGALDIGVEKKFKSSSLRINCSDIFGNNKWRWVTYIPSQNLDTNLKLDFETTILYITYSLNFGNTKLKEKGPRKSGSKEERQRL